jgi:RNA polymerase sigma factor (sigma-70 family)
LAHDLDLVEQARDGSQDAIVELWVRHYPAALAAARRTSRQPRDAEELASDAFSNMLGAFASGGGPTGSVRAYLLTSVRNLAVTRSRRSSSSEVLSEDVAVFEDGSRALPDPMSRQTEMSMMRQAFAALPRRWQVILWRTAVDHDRNIEIGHDLGISPNAVAALAKRARRGLRQAYLQIHLSTNGLDPGCEPFVRRLPMLAVSGSTAPDDLAHHLATCPTCPGRLAELQRVEQQLGSVLMPAVLLTAPGVLAPAVAGAAGAAAATTAATTATTATTSSASAAAAAGTTAPGAAGGTALPSTTSSLVAKLGAGKIAATAIGAAAAVSAALLVPHDDPPPTPSSAQVTPSSTPPVSPSLPRPTDTRPSPTTTKKPVVTRTPTTTPPPASQPAPTSPTRHRPTPTAKPARPATASPTTTVATTPLQVGLAISGAREATTIGVDARAEGTAGEVQLTVTVPAGVSLLSASGDWSGCRQSGDVISCTAASGTGRWSGTLVTGWADGATGRVTAEVAATYRSGGHATASAGANWPP